MKNRKGAEKRGVEVKRFELAQNRHCAHQTSGGNLDPALVIDS
jgi:hypothetical protein